jgi:hypothetical protein
MATEGFMIVSRVKVGWFIMAGSLFLFGLAALLSDYEVASLTPVENLLFLIALTLMIVGSYFVRNSKPCPACGEQLALSELHCRYCGYTFKDVRPAEDTYATIARKFRAKLRM